MRDYPALMPPPKSLNIFKLTAFFIKPPKPSATKKTRMTSKGLLALGLF